MLDFLLLLLFACLLDLWRISLDAFPNLLPIYLASAKSHWGRERRESRPSPCLFASLNQCSGKVGAGQSRLMSPPYFPRTLPPPPHPTPLPPAPPAVVWYHRHSLLSNITARPRRRYQHDHQRGNLPGAACRDALPSVPPECHLHHPDGAGRAQRCRRWRRVRHWWCR